MICRLPFLFLALLLPCRIEKLIKKNMAMDLVEWEYLKQMAALTPQERIARAASLFQWTREIIAGQIVSASGSMNPERLKWLVAMRQYGVDPATRDMIQRAIKNVSD
jgi:hypothetical protein